jgi:hypothetical protein
MLSQRTLDHLSVVMFIAMLFFSSTLDLVPGLTGPGKLTRERTAELSWPPPALVDLFWVWGEWDPLLVSNPTWLEFMAFASVPYMFFYMAAIFAFATQRGEWIRTPTIVWASMLSYSVVVILLAETYGDVPPPSLPIVYAAYSAYVYFPVYMIWRVGRSGPVFPAAAAPQKKRQ